MLYFKEIWVCPKIRVLPLELFPKLWAYTNFAGKKFCRGTSAIAVCDKQMTVISLLATVDIAKCYQTCLATQT